LLYLGCNDSDDTKNNNITPQEFSLKTLSNKHFNSDYLTFDTKTNIRLFLENYLKNILYTDRQTRREYWDSIDNDFFNYPDLFMKTFVNQELLLSSPVHLLALQKKDSTRYKAIIGFYNKNNFLIKISTVNVLLKNGKYILTNTLFDNIADFNRITSKIGSEYIISPLSDIESDFIDKIDSFNLSIATFFDVDPIKYRAILTPQNEDYLYVIGFVYSFKHYLDYKTGAITYPSEKLLLIGNSGRASIRHEIVHLYTNSYDVHPWLNEGICTYFGGSGTKELDELIVFMSEHLKKDTSLAVDEYSNFIAMETRYTSVLGAGLIKLALSDYGGKEAVFRLLTSGSTMDDFYQGIYDVFKVKRTDFDEFIKEKIFNYAKQ